MKIFVLMLLFMSVMFLDSVQSSSNPSSPSTIILESSNSLSPRATGLGLRVPPKRAILQINDVLLRSWTFAARYIGNGVFLRIDLDFLLPEEDENGQPIRLHWENLRTGDLILRDGWSYAQYEKLRYFSEIPQHKRKVILFDPHHPY